MPGTGETLNRLGLFLFVGCLCGAAGNAVAGPPAPTGSALDLRLDFIEQRLDAGETHARLWQYGWTGVNGVGLLLGTYNAITTDKSSRRVVGIVDAAKSAVGLADLVMRPLPGLDGAASLGASPGATPAEQEARLQAAEQLLTAAAARAQERLSPLAHLANLGINLVGGGVILAFGHPDDAAINTLTGFAVGEVQLLSAPWAPIQDLAEYQSRFGRIVASMAVHPWPGGVELAFRF